MSKWVYSFGGGAGEGDAGQKDLLGGKGANLAEMSRLGLPVPPGFTLTTALCAAYYADHKSYPHDLADQLDAALAAVENLTGKRFGATENPLLVSVRSGARVSMPGMMDTVLNLGLNDTTVQALAGTCGDERFAYDSYRRFIQMYADVVLGVGHHHFEELLEYHKQGRGIDLDTQMTAEDWKTIVRLYKARVAEESGKPFPQVPRDQLWGAIGAVFSSWMNARAVTYRALHNICDEGGTAVNVQAMVFGNMGAGCATGVCFSRNPSTGEARFYGEYLENAQGEDVVAGIRTPAPLTRIERVESGSDLLSMQEAMPDVFADLNAVRKTLEHHYRDMQDMEFTVEKGQLYMLQTRSGKRTAEAALRIAVEMCQEGLISKTDAIRRVDPGQFDQLLHPTLDPDAQRHVIGTGLPASPGAAVGQLVFDATIAEHWAKKLERKVILVRIETSPEDIAGMHASQGILTARGGMTSHAAVVARGMGTPCICGAGNIRIDYDAKTLTTGGVTLGEGDLITLDGGTGEIMAGEVATRKPDLSGNFGVLMGWADEIRRLKIRTNAETPADLAIARDFGAQGVGLCRTEHMFFEPERIVLMREMILAQSEAARRDALAKLLTYQRRDFVEMFRIMRGLPVTIRLLDPPLHEFLPQSDAEMQQVAEAAGVALSVLKRRAAGLAEANPMLGHRGCRLAISYPEIYEMQARAIFEAALAVSGEYGETVIPEIMVPLVIGRRELKILRNVIEDVAKAVAREARSELSYLVGTMIELPRAALLAGDIADVADFFSFGTNDLTQTSLGLSRDDSAKFMDDYMKHGIFDADPFVTIDPFGVGELVKTACERGRKTRADIKLGICGEHGGDPQSVAFCHREGLDYVSCSPYRIPIARLAAAQAALED